MFGIGTTEMMVVMVVCLVLFGNRLPGVMRGLGKSINEFKHGLHEAETADREKGVS